jgi:hypothetical protein
MNGFYDYYHFRHNIHCNAKDLAENKKKIQFRQIFNNEKEKEGGWKQSVID